MEVLVVGTGLIGTSVGLALRSVGDTVWLSDTRRDHVEQAAALGAGLPVNEQADPEVVLVAVPPLQISPVIEQLVDKYVNATFTDVGSVKTQPVREVEKLGAVAARFVGGHPMSGRETAGPAGARSDLFLDRPWILCPTDRTEPGRVEQVRRLAEACGAVVTEMSAEAHDRAVALTSHTPQVLASLMAGLIAGAPAADISLAGPGLRDLTRIAGSNPELWDDILGANAERVDAVLERFGERLAEVRHALHAGMSLREMLHVGNAGRSRIPDKHGGIARTDDVVVGVTIDDRPGALAALFVAASDAGINLEDVRIDHALGRPVAVVDLTVHASAEQALRELLDRGGWQVRF